MEIAKLLVAGDSFTRSSDWRNLQIFCTESNACVDIKLLLRCIPQCVIHLACCLQCVTIISEYSGVPGMGEGRLSPQKCRLALPTVKHTGQESGGELCEIFKFWSFPQWKSVKSANCFSFWPPRPPTGALLKDPSVPQTNGLQPPKYIPGIATEWRETRNYNSDVNERSTLLNQASNTWQIVE